jgi:hypothetical protein
MEFGLLPGLMSIETVTTGSATTDAENSEVQKEVITVAILTTDDFDATTVDHTTVLFERASETHVNGKTGEPRRHEEDVGFDGDIDLVLHLRNIDTLTVPTCAILVLR